LDNRKGTSKGFPQNMEKRKKNLRLGKDRNRKEIKGRHQTLEIHEGKLRPFKVIVLGMLVVHTMFLLKHKRKTTHY
jgi:hypothetical protein